MNILAIAKEVGGDRIIDHPSGYGLIQKINQLLPLDRQLEPKTTTGNDLRDLLNGATVDEYKILVNLELPDEVVEKNKIMFFPKVIVVYFSLSLVMLGFSMILLYIKEAHRNGYLPTSTSLASIGHMFLDAVGHANKK